MLSADLEYMRNSIAALLPDLCNILTAVNAGDGQGGMTQVWGTASTNVACRLDPGRKENREAVAGAVLLPFTYWFLTLPHGTTLTTTQRAEVGGYTYNVVSVDNGKSWAASVRAVVMKV